MNYKEVKKMTTATMTKVDTAFKALRKGVWVSSKNIRNVTGEDDLRSVRRLREEGYVIETRRTKDGFQYKRVN